MTLTFDGRRAPEQSGTFKVAQRKSHLGERSERVHAPSSTLLRCEDRERRPSVTLGDLKIAAPSRDVEEQGKRHRFPPSPAEIRGELPASTEIGVGFLQVGRLHGEASQEEA